VNLRAFVALEIDTELRDRLAEVIRLLKERVNGVRWVSVENLHLTMRFLGASSPESLERLEPALCSAATACPACDAELSGLGMFPERGSPRVLWLGTALPEPVFRLQEACEAAAVAAGFPPESRPFRSHLTLGRFREAAARPTLPSVERAVTRLERLVLFKSDLRQQGAVYTPLKEFRLGGA
jgi:2'-5' RNA ligase